MGRKQGLDRVIGILDDWSVLGRKQGLDRVIGILDD
jgi:hypothetical protein